MKKTTIWDFAMHHPILFTLIVSGFTTAAVEIVHNIFNDEEEDKNGN